VKVTRTAIELDLWDARRLSVPIAWFPRLFNATARQRARFRLIGDGEGIHWPALDEDLSVEALLLGQRPPPGAENFKSDLLKKRKK
jgi:uncharacterized protein DUF2442